MTIPEDLPWVIAQTEAQQVSEGIASGVERPSSLPI